MAQGLKQIVNEEKQTKSINESKAVKIRNSADFAVEIYNVLSRTDAGTARGLLKNTFNIERFVFDNTGQFSCPYALHAILITLSMGEHDLSDILNEMESFHIGSLKHSIAQVKRLKKPDNLPQLKQKLYSLVDLQPGEALVEKVNSLSGKNELLAKTLYVRFQVGDLWDNAVAELDKLSYAIEHFERKPRVQNEEDKDVAEVMEEAQEELWTRKELAAKLGFNEDNIQVFYNKSYNLAKSKKQVKEYFVESKSKGKKILLFRAKYYETYKKLFESYGKRPLVYDTKKFVTLPDLADLLGYKDNMQAFYQHRARIIKCNQEAANWFVEMQGRILFKVEFLDLFERLANAKIDMSQYWTCEELSKQLGCTVTTLYTKKSVMLKAYPEHKEAIQSWFVAVANTVVFDKEHFEEFRVLFSTLNRREFDRQQKLDKGTQVKYFVNSVKETKKPEVVADVKIDDKPKAKSHKSETKVVIVEPKPIKNLVDVKAYEKSVAEIINEMQAMVDSYDKMLVDVKLKQAEYDTLIDSLHKEQDMSKHVDMLKQASKQNEELIECSANIELLRPNASKAKQFLVHRQEMLDALKAEDTKMIEFWKQCQQIVK